MATAKISLSVSVVTNNNKTYKVTAKLYYYGNGSSWNSDGGDYKYLLPGNHLKVVHIVLLHLHLHKN